MTNPLWGVAYIIAVNLTAFLAFGWDKRQAKRDGQRISEGALLKLSLLGGSIGAKVAQSRFRHKTRKQPFARRLNLIVALQCAVVIAVVFWVVS